VDAGSAVPPSRGLSRAAERPALDTIASYPSIPSQTQVSAPLDLATGELLQAFDSLAKWELQNVARRYLDAGHRLSFCHRVRKADDSVQVRMASEQPRAFYAGLQTCGLVWLCPVCAPKIQAVRAAELKLAIEHASAEGLHVDMVVLTIPHGRRDDLRELVAGFRKAYASMTQSRAYRELAAELGLVGTVVSHEVTWGEGSGWHPHAHVLRFRERGGPPAPSGELHDHDARLFEMWRRAVERRGLGKPTVRAFRVQDARQAHEYVQKLARAGRFAWGIDDEMVRSHSKRGREGRFSPFDLLRQGAEGTEGPWRELWRTYAAVYKGSRQLVWSNGLKRRLGASEGRTDSEIAESIGERYVWARILTDDDWALVRRHKARGVLLQVAELAGRDGIELYLSELRKEK